MKKWYLVHSKPGKEYSAAINLEMQDFSVYLPVIGEKALKPKPMFPRYLFVSLSTIDDNWSLIRSTPGVSGIVMFGDSPACATNNTIDDVRELEEYYKHQSSKPLALQSGDPIMISSGSKFSGYEGSFCEYSSKDRAIVLLSHVHNSSVRVSVHKNLIRNSIR